MKLNKLALAVGALVISGSALAEFSANIGVTSNYVWRGVTQNGDDSAVQGGIDYAHDSGFYAGIWASNVAVGEEVDLYAGYAGEVGGLGYDIGVIHYAYPSATDADFTEIALGVSYSMFSGGINYTVDSENSVQGTGFQDGDIYYYVGASFEVAPTWSIGGTIGHYDFDDEGAGGAADISYNHYQIDVGKSAGDFGDFTLSFSKADKESGDDDLIVFASWAKTFD